MSCRKFLSRLAGFLAGYKLRTLPAIYTPVGKSTRLGFYSGLACRIVLFAGACNAVPPPGQAPAPAASATHTSLPVPRRTPKPVIPQATAVRFELRPSSTPLTTPTIQTTDLPGFGYGPTDFPPDVNPLTGLKVADPALLDRRPMVVKITNFPRSVRPQWGLMNADHIYEYYLEQELTRFVGIFYGQDASRIGPVRSARPFDEHLVRMYKAIFAFGYADDRVIDLWTGTDIAPFLVIEHDNNCPPMCRIGSPAAYNTLFTNTSQLSEYIRSKGINNFRQKLDGLRFENKTFLLSGGGAASRLEIRYSLSSYNFWDYDANSRRYLRWQDADRQPEGGEVYEPLTDSLTGQQIAADNLVVLLVPTGYFYHSNSTDIYDIQLKGRGKGYALRDGRIFGIEWRRDRPEAMLSIVFPGGMPYPLKPGNVWFEVRSSDADHIVNGQTWRFHFKLPQVPPTKTPKAKRKS